MRALTRIGISWLPLAIAITGTCMLVYWTVQQNYRQSLNDPQIQIAEDVAFSLAHGAVPSEVVPKNQQVDIDRSLSSFIGVYDEQGNPIETNGYLKGVPAKPPKGVFDYARTHGDNLPHDTWQLGPGLRMATVVVHVGDNAGFVVVGRNMKQVESRVDQLGSIVLLMWLFMLVATFIAKGIARYTS